MSWSPDTIAVPSSAAKLRIQSGSGPPCPCLTKETSYPGRLLVISIIARATLFAMHSSNRIFNQRPTPQFLFKRDGLFDRCLIKFKISRYACNVAFGFERSEKRVSGDPSICDD